MSTAVSLLNDVAVSLFGSILAASFCGALDSRRNRVVFWCCMVVIPLMSGWIYATWDASFLRMIYPLIIHLPLILLMSVLTKKPWWAAISVLTAYLCCQLRRWLALFVVALASGGHVMQNVVELAVTLPLLALLLRFAAPSIRRLADHSIKLKLVFGVIPTVYYVFDYATVVYTGILTSGRPVVVEFMPFVCCVAYIIFVVRLSAEQRARTHLEQLQSSLSSTWNHYYSEASIYYAEHGNLNVPKLYTTPSSLSLGVWLVTQRRVREGQIQGNLTEQQIARLDSIGMVWGNRKEIAWQHGFEVAKKYHDTYGNLMVPGKYVDPDGYPLGQWIIKTRQQKLNGRLKEERIAQLDEIGMVWSVFDAKWEKAYALAAAYYEENGNLNIPRSYVTAAGERLGQWVASQQWAYPKGKLTDEQVERLTRIGMYWGNRNDRQWNEGYQEAKRYFDAHGDLNVPADYVSPNGYNLGNWVKRQRYTRQNPEKSCAVLTEERIAKLDEIGMRWEKADSRPRRLELAQESKRKSENLNVSANHKTGEDIGLCS